MPPKIQPTKKPTTTGTMAKAPKTSPKTSLLKKPGPGPVGPGRKTASTSNSNTSVVITGSVGSNKSLKPLEEWTQKDDAARIIQTKFRQFRAKKEFQRRRTAKVVYEQEMNKLEKEAFVYLVKLQQEENERRQEKENEEKRKRQEAIKRKKKMLEAAFDGDIDVMKGILKEITDMDTKNGIEHDVIGRALRTKHMMEIVDCQDANGNTPLSEAANGGNADAITFLMERGANPDTVGQFKRTPLYRAAFGGHAQATQVLLENGANPKLYAQDGLTPAEIASNAVTKEIFETWDFGKTEAMQKKLKIAKEKRDDEDRQRKEAEQAQLKNVIATAEKEHTAKQKQLNHATCELNKRITEHDKAIAEGFTRTDITLQSIHDQELEVESMKIEVTKARDALAKAKLRLRENIKGEDGANEDDGIPGLNVNIKELDDVLFRDTDNRIKDSGKWPLLIDTSGQASTFLRYRDTNLITALRPVDMEKNNIRRSLIGAIRYGKPFVLDMMEVDMYTTCVDRFKEIMPNLMESIMDKSILKEEKYLKLVKKEDGPEYDKLKFNDLRLKNFKFVIVSKNPYLNEQLFNLMYVIKVVVSI